MSKHLFSHTSLENDDVVGVDVVISNVVGGAGSKGVIQVQQAKNDGYTLLLNGTDTIIGLNTFKKMHLVHIKIP